MALLRAANEKLVIATLQAQTATEVAERANQDKERFLAMLAHELRNPLAPIVNALAILRRNTSGDPTVTWVHDIIKRQVDQLKRLLDELLEVSRLTSGKVNLKKRPTLVKPVYKSKKQYSKFLQRQVDELSGLQRLHYASNRYALLLIFQAMDAAGKDGAIRHVMSGVNPQGCQVFSFKHPSAAELEHDFLWRTTRDLPERGRIGIFNRSYYEEVLIVRVHPEILRTQGLPDALHNENAIWRDRYRYRGPGRPSLP